MNVSLDEHRLGRLRWIVLRGQDREAFRGARGAHARRDGRADADVAAAAQRVFIATHDS
jgi:hypothetical protein